MLKRMIALCMTALLFLAMFPSASASETVPCFTVDRSLVIIGDSNTVFLKKLNPDIQPARIYARVNATIAECAENYSRYHADGYDYGIYQLIAALDGSSFHTVVINIGTNNAGTPTSSYKSDYRKLLNNLFQKNPRAVIYLCKILPINPAKYDGEYTEIFTIANIERINNAVSDLQQEYAAMGYDARIMDLYTPFQNAAGVLNPEYDSGGGIHLTVSGYKYLNKVVQTALAQGDQNANHKWVDGAVLEPASCAASGLQQVECAACGAVGTKAIPATGNHNWVDKEILKPATCTEDGTMRMVCSACGSEKTRPIPTNGNHTWDNGTVIREPSCTEAGEMHYVCLACGEEKTEQIAALGHVWTLNEVLTEGETLHESTGHYSCSRCGATKDCALCAKEVFTDMPKKSHWAHAAIDWAYFNGITGGTTPTTFSPKKTVTRAEAVTFLYAIYGKPAVEASNPFKDVKTKDYFYNAVLWAVDKGVTSGTKEDRFSPKQECSRAETVMFLWAAAGRPAPESTENPFRDVKSKQYYYNAVLWASENGITSGIDATHFAPKNNCTRAELMVFLMTAYPFLMNDPADPSDPGEPVDPVDPVDPADPTDPVAPADPTDPVDPTDPGEPTDSVEPGDLTASADPIDPSQIQP